MKLSHRVLFFLALGMVTVVLSGCPLLFIGSLGYTGYQYHEKEGVFAPGQPLGGPAPDDNSSSNGKSTNAPAKPPPPSNSDIE